MKFSKFPKLTVKELDDLMLPAGVLRYILPFADSPLAGDHYAVYMIKESDKIVSYAILSYDKGGIHHNPYDPTAISTRDIKWYLHYIQTEAEYQNKNYGSKLIGYICENVDSLILLFSVHSAKRFWMVKAGAKLLSDEECFYERSQCFFVLNVSDYHAYKSLATSFGDPDCESRWDLSLYVSGKGELTENLEYLLDPEVLIGTS